jgi:hypothetical protein
VASAHGRPGQYIQERSGYQGIYKENVTIIVKTLTLRIRYDTLTMSETRKTLRGEQ